MTLKGLAAFKAEKDKIKKQQEERERPKAKYFNWKDNKNKEGRDIVHIRFLQEVSEDVDTYREDRGLPLMQVEHQAPGKEGFKRRANCTLETEGQCYACESHAADRADAKANGRKQLLGWAPKRNFYIWALVDYKDGNGPQVVVISRSFASSFVEDLLVEVEEDPENRITDKMWKITKSGVGTGTQWKIRKSSEPLLDDSDVEVMDLEDAVLRKIPYDEQAAYYGQVWKEGDPLDTDDEPTAPAAEKTVEEKTGELRW